jgi:hypothetical protein
MLWVGGCNGELRGAWLEWRQLTLKLVSYITLAGLFWPSLCHAVLALLTSSALAHDRH